MNFNLISEMIGQQSPFYFIYQSRLSSYIRQQKDELRGISFWHQDKPLVEEVLQNFSSDKLSPLFDLVSNEIYFDLIAGTKKQESKFKGRDEIQKLINLTYSKYAQFIRIKIAMFYKDLSKLRSKLKKEKWKIKKIKRIPQPTSLMKISLDIRFGIIKRAKGKCEGCQRSIFESPIDVVQTISEGNYSFLALCKTCRESNHYNIVEEPDEEFANE